MKNNMGLVSGFLLGLVGFLVVFKYFVLVNISKEDELAPGIVILMGILNGVLFGFFGARLQQLLDSKKQIK